MSRYIDADALIETIRNFVDTMSGRRKENGMKKDEAEKLIRAYLPEGKLVMRINDTVYGIQLPKVMFDGAKTVKFRKVKMWRWFGIRVAIGMWVQRIGKRIEEGKRRGERND